MLAGLFLYIALSVYVFFSIYYLIARKYSHSYSFGDRILATFILGISQIILTEMVLGFSSSLVALDLAILNAVTSTCILICAGLSYKELSRQFGEVKEKLKGFFALIFRNRILLIIFIFAAVSVVWWSLQAIALPPFDWDGLEYHLPKVAQILQHHGIMQFASNLWVNQYPYNAELVSLWNVIFLRNDVLVNGSQIIFVLIAVLAIIEIARKVGVKPDNALFAMVFMFVPIVIQQATTSYIDIIVSSLVVTSVNFLLVKDKPRANLLILGSSIGIMVGAKSSTILIAVAMSFVLLLLIWKERRAAKSIGSYSPPPRRGLFAELCLYLAPILLLGGLWLVRNYVLYENPLAPVQVTLFGWTVFPGSTTLSAISHNTPIFTDPHPIIWAWLERSAPSWDYAFYNYDVGRGGFGPMFPIILLPSILFCLYIAFKKNIWSYLVVSLVFVAAFLLTPMNWWSRYTMFFCAYGVLSFTLIMEHLPKRKIIAMIALPIIVFSMIGGNTNGYYTPGVIVDFMHRPLAERQSVDLPIFFQDYVELFEKVHEKPGSTILYTDVPNDFSYLLWDPSFTNTVAQIPGQYANYESFIHYVEKFGESLIVTPQSSDITEYSNAHPNKLKVIYQKDNWVIISYTGGNSVQEP